jgi:hypothetical protein
MFVMQQKRNLVFRRYKSICNTTEAVNILLFHFWRNLPFDFVQGDGGMENGLLLCHFYDALRPQFKFCEQRSVRYYHSFAHSIEHAEKSVPALDVETPSPGDKTET